MKYYGDTWALEWGSIKSTTVTIKYSRDGGAFTNITTTAPNSEEDGGSYDWVIDAAPCSSLVVRVVDNDDADYYIDTDSITLGADVLFIGNSRVTVLTTNWGDYITSGLGYTTWVARNHGGMTTQKFAADIVEDLTTDQPRCVVMCDSVNDPAALSIDQTLNNWQTIKNACDAYGQIEQFVMVQTAPSDFYAERVTPADGVRVDSIGKLKQFIEKEHSTCISYGWKYGVLYDRMLDPTRNDYMLPAYTIDGVHMTADGAKIQADAILNAVVPTSKAITYGGSPLAYPSDSISSWLKSAGVTQSGSHDGSLVFATTGSTADSTVKCLGGLRKKITIAPTVTTGSFQVQIRCHWWNFLRDNAVIAWENYSDGYETHKMFYQVRLVSLEDNSVVDSIAVSWVTCNTYTIRTDNFGNRDGMIREWHKDTYIDQAQPARALGGQPNLSAGVNAGNKMYAILKPDIQYNVASNAVISSAKLHLFTYQTRTSSLSFTVRKLLTPCGLHRFWDEFNEVVADGGQATWNNAKADVVPTPWAGGGAISAADVSDAIATFTVAANTPTGTEFIVDITDHVQNFLVPSDVAIFLEATGTTTLGMGSQQHGTETLRWYLEVEHESKGGVRKQTRSYRMGYNYSY
jgi:hypothetical protein